ncbi:serine-rich adhesin for platelets [Filimonas sp.]|nr:serine-rich adhesin for platelets [Filimonas sp.]
MKKITTLLVLLTLCCMSLWTNAQYVPPTHVDGAAPNGILWDSVLTGRTLPVRTSTVGFSGVPGAVMFYDKATGKFGINPNGLSLSSVIVTYTSGAVNINGTTAGPFIYPSGQTGNGTYSPSTGTPRTFPAVSAVTGLPPTTFMARFGVIIGAPLGSALATNGDANNIASTNGFLNQPWSFGKVVNIDSLIANNQVLIDSNFKVIGQNSHANFNLLGYGPQGASKGTFQYSINGVTGTQVGAIVFYSSTPTCTAPTLSSSITNQSCSNLNDGAIDLTATGGSPAPTFAWSGPNNFTSTAEDISNLAPGTYTVIASSGTCTATASYTVNAGNPAQAASVSIASNAAGNTICAGTSVTFTATPTNGGTSPAYQWKLNGTNVGTNSDTYTTTSLVNSDAVTVEITSNAVCATGSPATSNSITTTVNQPTSSTSSDTACGSYTWSVNGQTYTQSGSYTSVINCATEILNLTILNIDTLSGIIPNPAVFPGGGQSSNIFSTTIRRLQCFYDSTNWTGQGVSGAIKITKLDFRVYSAVATSRTYSSVEIYLQQANVDFLSPSTTFANNRTSALGTPNYAGAITVNAGDAGTYQIQVPLTVPFTYDPTQGDLLVELVFLSTPSPSVSTVLDCGFNAALHNCNSVRSQGSTSTSTGSMSSFAPILRTSYISRSVNASSCGAYNWNINGQTYTQSGTYTGVNTCGDTLTLNLTVKSATTSSTTESATGSYTWNGNTYTTSGTYTWTGTNSVGCDSVATLNLTILSNCIPTSSTETITACSSYLFNGTSYTASGTYTWTGTNAAGCDSVVTLNLTITPQPAQPTLACYQTANFNSTTCQWDVTGTQPSQPSLACYESANFNTGTCSWVVTGTQPLAPTGLACYETATFNTTTCSWDVTGSAPAAIVTTTTGCDSYTWSVNGQTYTTSGSYTSVSGCATEILNLTITPSTSNTTTAGACDTYTWSVNGATYTSSGSYTSATGCATEILNLTITPSTSNTTTASACDTYTWSANGVTYTANGAYTATSLNAAGCTHTTTLNLTINNSTSSSVSATACNSYTWTVNGVTYTTSGTYTATSLNAAGCDSVHTLSLTVNYSFANTTSVSAHGCYVWNVNNTTYSVSGVYTASFINAAGCDSIFTLNLTITPGVYVAAKAILAGAYHVNTGLMHDSLRVKQMIPAMEPYSGNTYNNPPIGEPGGEVVSGNVLSVTGNNAIVDWVYLELRSATDSSHIIASKRGLLQCDGDIVSHLDGVSPVFFTNVLPASYFVSIKHRNHLGVMTPTAIPLQSCASTLFDFRTDSVYKRPNLNRAARTALPSTNLLGLWSADANHNKNVKYNGLSNDKDVILQTVGMPNNTVVGYRKEDLNMDGNVRYNNTDNDRTVIIDNLGISTPNVIISQHTPN